MTDDGSEAFYPPPPVAGSNAFGLFQLGVSPLGSIPDFHWQETILSQYANSPQLLGIIETFAIAMDQTENYDNFYTDIWNIDTATGYGLDVWGRIVGVGRVIELSGGDFFGMEGPTGASGEPYDVAPY